ncbi:MAG: toxin [Deltaproteobacteria bacterium]|nr:toxin [Candidatus Tharpella aukensis]
MFKWNPEKNKYLYEVRGITFEMVVQAISDGYGVSDVPHWNKEKYPNQRIITVLISGYAHLVPYVMDGDNYFLKTIIPSRKENKKVKGE